jgi:hypothetical protein
MTDSSRQSDTGTASTLYIATLESIEFTVTDEQGQPAKGWYYSLVDPQGNTQTGQLDDDGHAKIDNLLKGTCQVKIAPYPLDAQPAPATPAPAPDSPPYQGGAGTGPTATRRSTGDDGSGDSGSSSDPGTSDPGTPDPGAGGGS